MRNAKIIVVDDNEAVLRSLRTILSHEFKTIVTVSSPVLLPALLRNGDVDMVLLDMNFGAGNLFKPLSMCGNTVWNQIQIRLHLWPNLLLMHC